jgi:hypothetical protein
LTVIERVRKKIRDGDYEFTIPHFFEEMAEDNLILADIEAAIANGRIGRRYKRILAEQGMKLWARRLMVGAFR